MKQAAAAKLIHLLTAGLWIFPLMNAGGCIAFYSYKTVPVSVHDAETGKPIAGAKVHFGYSTYMDFTLNPPKRDTARTDANGNAKVRTVEYAYWYWDVSADGYLMLQTPVRTPVSTDFVLYRAPAPKITIVVPVGYHGPIGVEFVPADRAQEVAGKRDFTFHASPKGYVRIPSTPVMQFAQWNLSWKFIFADGSPVDDAPGAGLSINDDRYMLRFMTLGKSRTLYVLGNRKEEDAVKWALTDSIDGDPEHLAYTDQKLNAYFDQFIEPHPTSARPPENPSRTGRSPAFLPN